MSVLGVHAVARGLTTANPAMVAADSYRPSRSRMAARKLRVGRKLVLLPAVVVVADRHSQVLERGERIASSLDMPQAARYSRLVAAIAAVLCDYQAPAQGVSLTVATGRRKITSAPSHPAADRPQEEP